MTAAKKQIIILILYRGVAQVVECLLWEQDAAGSSPVSPTNPTLYESDFLYYAETRFF